MRSMAEREKKVYVPARINAKVYKRLEAFCEATARSRSEIVDRALEEYLDRHAAETKPHAKAGK